MVLTRFPLTSEKVRSEREDGLASFSYPGNTGIRNQWARFRVGAGVTLLVARLETRDESTVVDNGRGRSREHLPIIPWWFFDWPYLIAIADEIAYPWCRKAFSRPSCIISALQPNVLLTGISSSPSTWKYNEKEISSEEVPRWLWTRIFVRTLPHRCFINFITEWNSF